MKSIYKIAGVKRETVYSPNHVENDAAIFDCVARFLMAMGHEVKVYDEQALLSGDVSEKYVFNMVRNPQAMRKLQEMERCGVLAVNSGFGIENCTRERMTVLLLEKGIPHPKSLVSDLLPSLSDELEQLGFGPCWIKRADSQAVQKEDVCFVDNDAEINEVLEDFHDRGIKRVVVNEHLTGDLIKFYGVLGTPFFYWFYPMEVSHSKFGLEAVNGAPKGLAFSVNELKNVCERAAKALCVDVYGGDVIVAEDGTIRMIDFNDWPSFAPCREKAADAISHLIVNKIVDNEI